MYSASMITAVEFSLNNLVLSGKILMSNFIKKIEIEKYWLKDLDLNCTPMMFI